MSTTRQYTVVTLETALAVVQRAITEAEKREVQASVAVVDPDMNLIAFAKADGAAPHSVYSSRRKANTAASTRRPTGWMGDDLTLSIPLATALKLTNIKGGSPLSCGGTVSGAIGVAGGTPDQDAQIAAAAAAYAAEL
ncbi:MAG: heme-binding protein [Candidatus Sulfotelmatobacter sp.]